ncbi:MAG: hypothetical protein ACP5RT_02220 [Candidatus Micrarchaeia archaeon]
MNDPEILELLLLERRKGKNPELVTKKIKKIEPGDYVIYKNPIRVATNLPYDIGKVLKKENEDTIRIYSIKYGKIINILQEHILPTKDAVLLDLQILKEDVDKSSIGHFSIYNDELVKIVDVKPGIVKEIGIIYFTGKKFGKKESIKVDEKDFSKI